MKVNRTLLALGLFGVLQSGAIGQSTNLDLSTSAAKTQIKPVYPVVEYKLDKLEIQKPGTEKPAADKIARYGPDSSQPWVNIATRNQTPAAIHDASTHEPQLYLCIFGQPPLRR